MTALTPLQEALDLIRGKRVGIQWTPHVVAGQASAGAGAAGAELVVVARALDVVRSAAPLIAVLPEEDIARRRASASSRPRCAAPMQQVLPIRCFHSPVSAADSCT